MFLLKYKKFFKLGVRKFHLVKHKKFFHSVFVVVVVVVVVF